MTEQPIVEEHKGWTYYLSLTEDGQYHFSLDGGGGHYPAKFSNVEVARAFAHSYIDQLIASA
jgi:hypothetical protein